MFQEGCEENCSLSKVRLPRLVFILTCEVGIVIIFLEGKVEIHKN